MEHISLALDSFYHSELIQFIRDLYHLGQFLIVLRKARILVRQYRLCAIFSGEIHRTEGNPKCIAARNIAARVVVIRVIDQCSIMDYLIDTASPHTDTGKQLSCSDDEVAPSNPISLWYLVRIRQTGGARLWRVVPLKSYPWRIIRNLGYATAIPGWIALRYDRRI